MDVKDNKSGENICENLQLQQQRYSMEQSHDDGQESNQDPNDSIQCAQKCMAMLRRYAEKYPVFQADKLKLAHLLHTTNKNQLQHNKTMLKTYFNYPAAANRPTPNPVYTTDALFDQFHIQMNKIRKFSLIYCSIREVELNRFNLLIRAPGGELVAYYETILRCKIIAKIVKLLQKVAKPCCFILQDYSKQPHLSTQLAKIREVCQQFFYRYEHELSELTRDFLLHSQPRCKQLPQFILHIYSNRLVAYTPIFNSPPSFDFGHFQFQTMAEFDNQDNQLLSSVTSDAGKKYRKFAYDFLAVNVARIYRCSGAEVTQIIQKLIMDQQKIFEKKDQLQRKKQKQWQQSKDKDAHFPERMFESKKCKRCQNLPKRLRKKSIFRCEGCSAIFEKDIALCPQCFGDFHERIDYFQPRIAKLNRAVIRRIQKSNTHNNKAMQKQALDQNMNSYGQQSKLPQQKIALSQQTAAKFVELNQKMCESMSITRQLISSDYLEICSNYLQMNLLTCMESLKNSCSISPPYSEPLKLAAEVLAMSESTEQLPQGYKKGSNHFLGLDFSSMPCSSRGVIEQEAEVDSSEGQSNQQQQDQQFIQQSQNSEVQSNIISQQSDNHAEP